MYPMRAMSDMYVEKKPLSKGRDLCLSKETNSYQKRSGCIE